MHTLLGTKWEAVQSELDDLWCPLMEFVAGAAESDVFFLFEGSPKNSDESRFYLLKFRRVEMVTGYSESIYCILSEDQPRATATKISAVVDSPLVALFQQVRRHELRQFMIASGGMHCELIAHPEFKITRHASRDEAVTAARQAFERKTINLEGFSPEARSVLDRLRAKP